jgi:type I restriction enzyme, S subunit
MTWQAQRLGDVLTLKRGHDLPDSQRQDGDVPVVSSSGITGCHNEPKAKAPGVVTGRYGTLGEVFYIEEDYWPLNTALYVIDFKGNRPHFVAYFLENVLRNYQSDKAAVPGVNRNVLHEIKVRCPDTQVQDRIANILSAYDDLIENNRRRMALLEDAARQLYREWFVRLRFPGYEHTPVTNGVPEGWVRKSLGEVADFRLGKMLDQNKNKGELMPYLANVNVRWGEIDLDNLREMRFEDNEVDTVGLRYGDIVMCEGGEPGRCALWKEQLPRMMIQKAIHRIRAHPEVSYLFLYYCLRHKGQSGQLAPLFTGATIKHLPREKLALVQVEIPPVPLMALFAEQVDFLERQITLLEGANKHASQARDLLLPRLMSGEISV